VELVFGQVEHDLREVLAFLTQRRQERTHRMPGAKACPSLGGINPRRGNDRDAALHEVADRRAEVAAALLHAQPVVPPDASLPRPCHERLLEQLLEPHNLLAGEAVAGGHGHAARLGEQHVLHQPVPASSPA
jgi:hypothetical protein